MLIGAAVRSLLYGAIGPRRAIPARSRCMLWSACGAMLMAGAAQLDDDLSRSRAAFAGAVLSVRLPCGATARESALKYLILSSTASGFLLFGMALLFGAREASSLADSSSALASSPLFWLGGGMFLIGLAFKLSLVPFHIWTPDVYEARHCR